ncbi:hypothetical protein [Aeromicrobium sp. A1-2]|uniref:hypothetical protein n=1 Tax=Aeromicrobium sp. A1-2 TaxID=2107713 RepID=UPI0013C2B421|nr:hypothetical protein [Aeromicrobium sp. A1-2]
MADSGRRPGPNTVAVLVLIALCLGLLLWQRPWQGAGDPVPEIPADASSALTAQFRALSQAESEASFTAAAGTSDAAKVFAQRAWQARTELGATAVAFRYVMGGEVADRSDGSASADVEVTWSAGAEAGLDVSTTRTSSVAFRVAPQGDGGFSIVSATPRSGPLPLWLAGAVKIERPDGAVVIRVDGGDPELPVESMATAARDAVLRVLPGTKGEVTVISPHSQKQMAQLVGQPVKEITQIAAVTTRLDGRSGSADDIVVVLNPTVFSTMDRRAAQVVLSHEATHLLTEAVGTRAESWVVEGFADFVALRDDSASLAISAGQILAEVKADGAPGRLPTAADFDSGKHGLGAVYESAWMAFRLLGERYGDAAVVGFYQAVLSDMPLDSAVDKAFGITVGQLTTQWRAYLAKSASIVS